MSSGIDALENEQGNPDGEELPEQSEPKFAAIQFPPWFNEAKLVENVRDWRKQDYDAKREILQNIEENWKIVENKPVFGLGMNAEIIPKGSSIKDTYKAKLSGAIIGQEKLVDAVPKDAQNVLAPDANDRTSKVEDLINEKIRFVDEYEDKLDELLDNLLVETLMIAEVQWSVKTEKILQVGEPQIDPLTGAETVGQADMVDYECSGPDFEPVSLRYMMWEPREKNRLSRAAWVGRKRKVSADDLRQDEQNGIAGNVEVAIRQGGQTNTSDSPSRGDSSDPQAKQIKNVEGRQLPTSKDAALDLEVWHAKICGESTDPMTGEKKYEQGEFRFWMVGDTCVKFDKNPFGNFKPYVMSRMSRKPDQLTGMGPIDLIKGLMRRLANDIQALNELTKQASDNPTFFEPTTMLDSRRTILQQGSLIAVLSVDGIKRMEPPVEAIRILRENIAFWIDQINDATASNEQAQGIESQGDVTATEATITANSSNLRTQYTSNQVVSSLFAEMAWFFFKMFQQFGTPENMIIHEAGTDGTPSSLQLTDLAGDYIFKPVLAMSQQSRNQRFNLLKGLVTDLNMASKQDPNFLINGAGVRMKVNNYEFLTQKMLPLVDVYGAQKLFVPMTPMDMSMSMPGQPGMPPMPGEMPMEGAPEGLPPEVSTAGPGMV